MNVIAIIPARMAATRFPGKPLAKICGMPMIGHCWHRTRIAVSVSAAYVATCDEEITLYARSIGAPAIMTSSKHERATDRTAEAMLTIERQSGTRIDVVLMVQGDEPLITPEAIEKLSGAFEDPSIEIANLMGELETEEEFRDTHNVKVVTNCHGDALYFSREPIPSGWKNIPSMPMRNQMGIIGFRRDALIGFNELPETDLERFESVDMNRVLESGGRVRMVPSPVRTIGVDTPNDLDVVDRLMRSDPLFVRYSVAHDERIA